MPTQVLMAFPGGSDSKESARKAGDLGLISGSGRAPGGGNGNPFQWSCLESPMDRRAWWATVYGVTESEMTEQLHTHTHTHTHVLILIVISFYAHESGLSGKY